MLKVYVDSASSVKQNEKEKYDVEIIPLRYMMGDKEYLDDIDLTIDEFYDLMINKQYFPKTSLPNLVEVEEKVLKDVNEGYEVVILTMSSGLSGTYSAIKTLFAGNDKVYVVDSLSCVGGERILVEEINKNRDKSAAEIVDILQQLIPRIKIVAIPETLDYLLKGGRLSRKEWLLGSILKIKPVITLQGGNVHVLTKKIGVKNAVKYLATALEEMGCDTNYSIIPSYTYNSKNVDRLLEITDKKYLKHMGEYDNLDPVVACHWGPNAFGYIFIGK